MLIHPLTLVKAEYVYKTDLKMLDMTQYCLVSKKVITEVLFLELRFPLYVILFVIWWQFRHVIKMSSDSENILNKNEFFADTAGTSKEPLSSINNKILLKGAITKVKLIVGKNNALMKGLIKLGTKLSINPMMNTSSLN